MKWLWVATLISLSALQAGECVVANLPSFGSLEVTTYDRFGSSISPAPTRLLYPSGKVAYESANGRFPNVAYGSYQLRVEASGFYTAALPFEFAQKAAHARVPLTLGSIGCPPGKFSIRGRVLSGHPYADLWLKAMPIRGAGATEGKVGEYGFFEIGGLDAGDYFLVVSSGHKIVYQATVKFHDQQPLALELPKQ